MAMTAPNHGLTGKQLAALNLAACPNGCTEAAMKANGFGIGLLATLVRAGLAVATPGVVQAGGDAGRGAARDHGDGASDGRRMMGQGARRGPRPKEVRVQ